VIASLCVYCGSSGGRDPKHRAVARLLGEAIAVRGIRLVYGGSHLGLMGELAESVLLHGGQVTGIVPELLVEKEAAHRGLNDLRVVGSMHERKALMAALSDGFVAMPGGYGTLDELCEMLTWAQIGSHQKPIVLLNSDGYFDHLLRFLEHAVVEGFLRDSHFQLLRVATCVPEVFAALSGDFPALGDKWVS
jgi:uncharacterized protein (TIGR00730 family)